MGAQQGRGDGRSAGSERVIAARDGMDAHGSEVHALPGFATFRELSGHQERPRGSPSSFLNRASQVRVLPGAPVNIW